MSIHGLTIDYGPYAFLDDYDKYYICNHTDRDGRYSFGNQPAVAEWNLKALIVALLPMVPQTRMEEVLAGYGTLYSTHYVSLMAQKLGFDDVKEGDRDIISHLLGTLQQLQVDYTLFFRTLSRYDGDRTALLKLGLYHTPMHEWLDVYDARLKENASTPSTRHSKMLRTNPKYVLKNYMLQEAIEAAKSGDYSLVDDLFTIACDPFAEYPQFERWAQSTPEAFKNSKLSCSS